MNPLISIVSPVYQEQEVIGEFCGALIAVLRSLPGYRFEILFIDDGSTDSTAANIRSIAESQAVDGLEIRLISFSRNFGHQYALTCGMDLARGEAVITMDADLQHPPELIPEMLEQWRRHADIVSMVRDAPQAGAMKNLTSKLFYKVINFLSEIPISQDAADFRLMSRRVVEVFRQDIRERDRFLRGLVNWVGFRCVAISFTPRRRAAGSSKYNWRKMWRLACSGLVSFSTFPLKLGIYLGILMGALSLVYGTYALVIYFTTDRNVTGWTSLMLYLTLVSALIFLILGLLGVYIGHIFDEVKRRPLYIVRASFTFPPGAESGTAQREDPRPPE